MDITMKFPTGQDFDRLLADVEKKIGIQVLRNAGRAAMEPVLADAQQHAGFDGSSAGPHMRDDLKITSTDMTKKSGYPTAVTVRVGVSKAHHIKAWAQEQGTRKQVARPFLRPALDYNKTQVLKILSIRLREALESK